MARKFSEPRKKQLKRIWKDCGGQEQQAENFIRRLAYFFDTCMAHKFNETLKEQLKLIWKDYGGQEQQAENFVGRLAYFFDNCRAHKFDETQKKRLKQIWGSYPKQKLLEKQKLLKKKEQLKKEEQQAENFIRRLSHFLDNCPKLITGSHEKIETEESRDFANVAKHCKKLLEALGKIPDTDRINILSIYEKRPEYGGRNVPICDPLDYVKGIQELAKFQSDQLKNCKKYERQLYGLQDFLNGFPPLQKISGSDLIKIAGVLWDEINEANFEKAYRPEEKRKNNHFLP